MRREDATQAMAGRSSAFDAHKRGQSRANVSASDVIRALPMSTTLYVPIAYFMASMKERWVCCLAAHDFWFSRYHLSTVLVTCA